MRKLASIEDRDNSRTFLERDDCELYVLYDLDNLKCVNCQQLVTNFSFDEIWSFSEEEDLYCEKCAKEEENYDMLIDSIGDIEKNLSEDLSILQEKLEKMKSLF